MENNKINIKIEHDENSYQVCEECGEVLSEPILESREGGYSEFVTYCKCGATYTS